MKVSEWGKEPALRAYEPLGEDEGRKPSEFAGLGLRWPVQGTHSEKGLQAGFEDTIDACRMPIVRATDDDGQFGKINYRARSVLSHDLTRSQLPDLRTPRLVAVSHRRLLRLG